MVFDAQAIKDESEEWCFAVCHSVIAIDLESICIICLSFPSGVPSLPEDLLGDSVFFPTHSRLL